jgi:hypothetical protein
MDFASNTLSGTINAATTTVGVAPSCQASFGSDVWYTVTVPASGNLIVETQVNATNSMTDSVVAAFTGSCGTLTQVGCDDDSGLAGPNNTMSVLTLTGLTPGTLLYVAVWKWQATAATSSNSQFKIAAYDCPSATPAPTGAASQFVCVSGTVADLLASGTAVKWYAGPVGGTVLLSTDALVSGNIYYGSQTLTCESFNRFAVTVTVVGLIGVTPGFATVCEQSIIALSATGTSSAVTWSPQTELYTDPAATISYIAGTDAATVYAKPTADVTYTASSTTGGCTSNASSVITVTQMITPTFNALPPICQGSSAPALPATSANGFAGTWSPSSIDTSTAGTATYTFTPDFNQCATQTTLDVTVNPTVVPTFDPIASVCVGSSAPALAATSNNGVSGTWSPATVDTSSAGTDTYTFTPDAGQCATVVNLDVTIDAQVVPTFDPIAAVCIGSPSPSLEVTSLNGIPGTWFPASVDTSTAGTTTYTFTPDAAQCATTATLDITIDALTAPTFDPIAPICEDGTAPALGSTSTNGISGTWSPATIDTSAGGTTTYTFTPDVNQCASEATMDITINSTAAPTGDALQPACAATTLDDLMVVGSNIIWYDADTLGNVLPSTTAVIEGVTYYASQTVSSCESIDRLAVTGDSCLANDTFTAANFEYYPNPVSNVLNISHSAIISKVEVINIVGQLVNSQAINSTKAQIDMSGLPSGSYLVRVSSANQVKMIKVIKR